MIKYFILSNYYFDKNVIKEVNYDTIVMWYNTSYISFKNTLYEAFNEIMSYRIGTQKNAYIIKIDVTNIIHNNKFTNSDMIHIYNYEDLEHLRILI